MKGLCEVIIRADLEADDAVEQLVPSGQHDDSDVGCGADLAGERQTVLAWHDHVEQDDVYRPRLQLRAHLRAIRGGADPIALLLEIAGEHLTNPRIVVDNKNLDGLFCRLDH